MDKIKLSKKRYPILEALEYKGGNLLNHPKSNTEDSPFKAFGFYDPDEKKRAPLEYGLKGMAIMWHHFGPAFSQNVTYFSSRFYESIMAVEDKLMTDEMFDALLERQDLFSGTLISGDTVICYHLKWTKEKFGGTLAYMQKNIVLAFWSSEIHSTREDAKEISYQIGDDQKNEETQGLDLVALVARHILMYYTFKYFADIQVVQSRPYKKVQTENNESILVESDILVDCMSCKWITTIVRSEGFKVRGHFRLQPYKIDGEWTKRLIYINEYEKHGYTRRAQKLIDLEKASE